MQAEHGNVVFSHVVCSKTFKSTIINAQFM